MSRHLICVGFGKCGTTLLDHFLARSPGFTTPVREKEICYFDQAQPSYRSYLDHFSHETSDDRAIVCFEASPQYVTGRNQNRIRETFVRIKETVPDALILICLRHPAYRAGSVFLEV